LRRFAFMFLPPVKDPTGTEMLYVMENEVVGFGKEPKTTHKSKVVAIDAAHDLALVRADKARMPEHHWLRVADFAPKVGEKVFIVGHPGGLYFTFFDGTVAAYRETFPFEKDTPLEDFEGPFIQIYSAIYFGNSGGPAISANGEIVGISSFISEVPNQGFVVAPSAIKKFLIKAHLQDKF
ncbi:MAG TPA: serine protease, partial [Flavobacterium sp.]|nr:serine protease [Flavobacterium sp.]